MLGYAWAGAAALEEAPSLGPPRPLAYALKISSPSSSLFAARTWPKMSSACALERNFEMDASSSPPLWITTFEGSVRSWTICSFTYLSASLYSALPLKSVKEWMCLSPRGVSVTYTSATAGT